MKEPEDKTIYKVVFNDEGQYSIWSANRASPFGWRESGESRPQEECRTYIRETWTDSGPVSLRNKVDGAAQ